MNSTNVSLSTGTVPHRFKVGDLIRTTTGYLFERQLILAINDEATYYTIPYPNGDPWERLRNIIEQHYFLDEEYTVDNILTKYGVL